MNDYLSSRDFHRMINYSDINGEDDGCCIIIMIIV